MIIPKIPLYLNNTNINTLENEIIMQTREEDTEIVDKLNQTEPNDDHYMYLMPDDFIVEAVINPMEWTKEEYFLAKEILKLRNIEIGQK